MWKYIFIHAAFFFRDSIIPIIYFFFNHYFTVIQWYYLIESQSIGGFFFVCLFCLFLFSFCFVNLGPVNWLSREECLLPSLTTWVWSLEPRGGKKETNYCLLSLSRIHTNTCMCTCTYKQAHTHAEKINKDVKINSFCFNLMFHQYITGNWKPKLLER